MDRRKASGSTVAYRMRKAGMNYEDAISTPVGNQGVRRPFSRTANSKAVRRYHDVLKSLEGVKRVLARWPRDVKANARFDRMVSELVFLESLFDRDG